jgi:lipoprotein-releasing system permease protein
VADLDDPFGSLPQPSYGRPRKGVIVGDQLFRVHGLRRGSEIEILVAVPDASTGEWLPCNRKFVVVGTFRSGESDMDMERIYLERSELVDFLGGERRFNEVLVRLHDYENDALRVRDAIAHTLATSGSIGAAGFEVRTWEEVRSDLIGAIENERVMMAVMLSLVLLVAGFTIFAILSMLVTEKRRDIGILTALGATPRGVMAVFVLIAFWDALLGATLGAVAGCTVALHIDAIERWVSNTTADLPIFGHSLHVEIFNRSVYLFDHIPSIVEPWRVALIVFGAFLCALVFSAIPALKAARLDPLIALRHD